MYEHHCCRQHAHNDQYRLRCTLPFSGSHTVPCSGLCGPGHMRDPISALNVVATVLDSESLKDDLRKKIGVISRRR